MDKGIHQLSFAVLSRKATVQRLLDITQVVLKDHFPAGVVTQQSGQELLFGQETAGEGWSVRIVGITPPPGLVDKGEDYQAAVLIMPETARRQVATGFAWFLFTGILVEDSSQEFNYWIAAANYPATGFEKVRPAQLQGVDGHVLTTREFDRFSD